jgi:hypothetical protein
MSGRWIGLPCPCSFRWNLANADLLWEKNTISLWKSTAKVVLKKQRVFLSSLIETCAAPQLCIQPCASPNSKRNPRPHQLLLGQSRFCKSFVLINYYDTWGWNSSGPVTYTDETEWNAYWGLLRDRAFLLQIPCGTGQSPARRWGCRAACLPCGGACRAGEEAAQVNRGGPCNGRGEVGPSSSRAGRARDAKM